MYICLNCKTNYNVENLKKGDDGTLWCPHQYCGSEVIEIDDLMVPTILRLNEIAYTTQFCCSGHYGSLATDPYICCYHDSLGNHGDDIRFLTDLIYEVNRSVYLQINFYLYEKGNTVYWKKQLNPPELIEDKLEISKWVKKFIEFINYESGDVYINDIYFFRIAAGSEYINKYGVPASEGSDVMIIPMTLNVKDLDNDPVIRINQIFRKVIERLPRYEDYVSTPEVEIELEEVINDAIC